MIRYCLSFSYAKTCPFCRNVDSVTFAEFCEKLTERLQKLEDKKLAKSDSLQSMKNLLTASEEKDNLNKTDKEKDDSVKPPQ